MTAARYLVALLGCVGFLWWGTAGAQADTQTAAVGDSGGTNFTAACDPGEALVGFDYNNSFERLQSVSLRCKPVLPGGLGTVHRFKTMYGKDDEHPITAGFNSSQCPEDMAVVQLQVYVGNNLVLERVRLSCHVLVGNKIGVLLASAGAATGDSKVSKNLSCPNYATGLFGTYKGGIRSLGLICRDDSRAADTGNGGKGGAKGGGKGNGGPFGNGGNGPLGNGGIGPFGNGSIQVQVNIGPKGASIGTKGALAGPQGKVRLLREPSTVYADKGQTEIAYLDAGDKVTVLGCENGGKGWCQISKPSAGLIWGGDLK